MSEIPEDIMMAARKCVAMVEAVPSDGNNSIIARAILAERQRCADTARRYMEDIAGCDMSDDEPDKIAAAIIDPQWAPPPL